MSVTFVNGESFIERYGITGNGEYTPVFMEKDGKRLFIRNIVRPLRAADYLWCKYEYERSIEETEKAKEHLIQTDGKWYCSHGINKNPFEFIKWVQEHKYTFQVWGGSLFKEHKDFTDFHGNLVEYSAAFSYRIYDEAVLSELKSIVGNMPKRPL